MSFSGLFHMLGFKSSPLLLDCQTHPQLTVAPSWVVGWRQAIAAPPESVLSSQTAVRELSPKAHLGGRYLEPFAIVAIYFQKESFQYPSHGPLQRLRPRCFPLAYSGSSSIPLIWS